MNITLEVDLPGDLEKFHLPPALAARLQDLLNRQQAGEVLSDKERDEATALVNLTELLTLLRLRVRRIEP
jgi:hypothetical protein